MIYFIQNTETKAIKIGYTANDPRKRLKQLQTGSSSDLLLLRAIDGDRSLEKTLHNLCARWKINGEWYTPNVYLGLFIWYKEIIAAASKISLEDYYIHPSKFLDFIGVDKSIVECIDTAIDVEFRINRTED